MLKYICDKCGEEMRTDKEFSDLRVVRVNHIVIPGKMGKSEYGKTITETHYHFCKKCVSDIILLCQSNSGGN